MSWLWLDMEHGVGDQTSKLRCLVSMLFMPMPLFFNTRSDYLHSSSEGRGASCLANCSKHWIRYLAWCNSVTGRRGAYRICCHGNPFLLTFCQGVGHIRCAWKPSSRLQDGLTVRRNRGEPMTEKSNLGCHNVTQREAKPDSKLPWKVALSSAVFVICSLMIFK